MPIVKLAGMTWGNFEFVYLHLHKSLQNENYCCFKIISLLKDYIVGENLITYYLAKEASAIKWLLIYALFMKSIRVR